MWISTEQKIPIGISRKEHVPGRFCERIRVRWPEVDSQRVVFSGHYLSYFVAAMSAYWRTLALPYDATLDALGGDLFLRNVCLDYRRPAELDDLLDIDLRLERIGRTSLRFSATARRDLAVLVQARLSYVYVDKAARVAQPVPAVLADTFCAYEAGRAVHEIRVGSWAQLAPDVKRIAAAAQVAFDGLPESRLAVIANGLGAPVAAAAATPEGRDWRLSFVAVHPSLRHSGWGSMAVAALARACGAALKCPSGAQWPSRFLARCGVLGEAAILSPDNS